MTRLDMINQCFCGESCEEILFSLIREGRSKNIEQCLETEYIAISNLIAGKISHNYYEGARAMLIDKDKKPQWVPSKLEDVTEEMVAKCFSRSFTEDDDWLPLELPTKTSGTHVGASKL
ncbi:putative 3-hydroxyisobutyryl-CoA hydrolase [Helianthus annuus]|nr:putative 3-hydroxyisobutyryl-CoA hydrolase [Helianthus annuus]KAJ0701181.1 putative 3-hydroxyisobutyryl-CoA hydrolase [Helianthus annuus]